MVTVDGVNPTASDENLCPDWEFIQNYMLCSKTGKGVNTHHYHMWTKVFWICNDSKWYVAKTLFEWLLLSTLSAIATLTFNSIVACN